MKRGLTVGIGSVTVIQSLDTFNTTTQFVVNPNTPPCKRIEKEHQRCQRGCWRVPHADRGRQRHGCAQADTNSTEPGGWTDSNIATSYTSYSVTFNGGALDNINYIRMAVNGGAGRDVFVDFVNADVPEPGTFALAGGVLLIMGLFRRRSANFPRWLDSPMSYRGLDRQPPFFFRLTNTATIE